MEKRQAELLKQIIKIYIRTAEPVGSIYLSDKIGNVSSATIRNEMMELEEGGWIYQPHTSAGRVPTTKAYRFFVENFIKEGQEDKTTEKELLEKTRRSQKEDKAKSLAKAVAEMTEEAVVVAFNPNQFYYTGLSFLFSQPEFREQARVTSISQILDHGEEVIPQILEILDKKSKVLIGEENPFGVQCSFITAPIYKKGMFGILGPVRMDYEKGVSLINIAQKILDR